MLSTATPTRWLTVVIVLTVLASGHAAKILGVLPHRGWSHYASFQPLLLELARRGHEVTVLCPFEAPKDAPKTFEVVPFNYETQIVDSGTVDADYIHSISYSFLGVKVLEAMGDEMCNEGLKHPSVEKILNSKEEYDLIIVEVFDTDCYLGFTHRFKAPVIGLSSHVLLPWANDRMGVPASLAFISSAFVGFPGQMGLLERVRNTVEYVGALAYYKWVEWSRQKTVKDTFGTETPSTLELARKIDMVFVNSHESLDAAKPLPPSIVNVAGMHLPKAQPLSEDLRTFVDGAKEGVIYFNMGSLLRGESFPKSKVDALLKAFGQLKQRVIWKWEGPPPKNAPTNIKFLSWVRQFDVLQHPNVKVFMSHGGMLGTVEAIYSGVTIVVIPMFGDQFHNAAGIVNRGVARKLPYLDLDDSGKILEVLRDVLDNPKYAQTAKKNSELFRDRPVPPLDLAVYWSEFLIKHKGAPHLKPASTDMPYYQLLLLDVLVVLLTPIVFLWWVIRKCSRRNSNRRKSKRD